MLRVNKNTFTSIETVTVTSCVLAWQRLYLGRRLRAERPQEEQELSIPEDLGGMPEGGGEGEKGQHVLTSGEEA